METTPELAQQAAPRKRWRSLVIMGGAVVIVAALFGAYRYVRHQHSNESLTQSYLAQEIPPTDLIPLSTSVDIAELWTAPPEEVLVSYTALPPAQLRKPVHQLGLALAHLQLGHSVEARKILVSLDLQLSLQRNQARWLAALSYLQKSDAASCAKLCQLVAQDAQDQSLRRKASTLSSKLSSWWRK